MKKWSYSKLLLFLIALVGVLIFLHYLGILQPVEGFLIKAFLPIQEKVYSGGSKFNEIFLSQRSKMEVLEENERLKEEIHDLISENSKLKIFEEENEILRKQMGFLNENEYKFLVARVVGKSPDLTYNTILLNKGEKDGLEEGLPVILDNGFLLGKIIETTYNSSVVLLITDNRSKIAASIQNSDKTIGLVEGEHGLSMKMSLIPQNETISTKDLVITSGLEEKIPKGLLVGRVSRVIDDDNALFQSAIIEGLLSFNKLEIVSVILPN